MKIGYLILAHNNFRHLERLIDALDDAHSAFYIHIDKKARQDYKPRKPNVSVIPAKFDINWGGFTMVEATLALLEYGVEHSPDAGYYILISGVDYPVRPKTFLYSQLEKKKEYIDISPLPVPYKPAERYEYYYFDYNRRNPKLYNPKFLLEVLLKKLKIKRKAPFRVYAGSQWFALTAGCVQYILKTVNEDTGYVDFFCHTLVPDEAFFQTIIGNSPFREETMANLTYTDWEAPSPPAVIEKRHVDFLRTHMEFNDEYGQRFPYFARKFDDGSDEIIAKIQSELWK
jgi:hypothetical protein